MRPGKIRKRCLPVRTAYDQRPAIGESCNRLAGDIVYDSESTAVRTALETLLIEHREYRIRIIIPSHLGYGFSGDGKRIPSGASLLYDIEVKEVLIPPAP